MTKSESVVLCEGYHDRAFWKGWLLSLGFTDLWACAKGSRSGGGVVDDPWDKTVSNGQYAFRSPDGSFLRVHPVRGRGKILDEAKLRLKRHTIETVDRLVLCIDSDTDTESNSKKRGMMISDILPLAKEFDEKAKINKDGDIDIKMRGGGDTKLSVVRWEAGDKPTAGVPPKETLERLVCASIVAAYPKRGEAVQDWLKKRPSPPKKPGASEIAKSHAWSYMAGWHAEKGCETFYEMVWQDPKLVPELESRLRDCGAWQVAERLAGQEPA